MCFYTLMWASSAGTLMLVDMKQHHLQQTSENNMKLSEEY